jgi:hypothetical protein
MCARHSISLCRRRGGAVLSWGVGRSPPRPTVSVLGLAGDDDGAGRESRPAHADRRAHDGDGVGYSMVSTKRVKHGASNASETINDAFTAANVYD